MPNWVLWKWQLNEKGDWTKPPYKASDPKQHAKSNNPETWSDRHAAVNAVLAGKANGTGFVLTGTDVAAIDLDKCRNPVTGSLMRCPTPMSKLPLAVQDCASSALPAARKLTAPLISVMAGASKYFVRRHVISP
jgi:hypothetical protein